MRTPILSIIFFLKLVIDALSSTPFNVFKIPRSLNYCELIMSQLEFINSFVNDLIDLRMLETGTFSLIY